MLLELCPVSCQSIATITQLCVRQCWLQKNVQHMKLMVIVHLSLDSTAKIKFWSWILLLTLFNLKCRSWNFKLSTNSKDPKVVTLSQVYCGSFFDSNLETLTYTIWLHKTSFTSTVLAISSSYFFPILSCTCFLTVLQKSDSKASLQIKTYIFLDFMW